MFNWKKHCFICLSLLSFPLLSTFIQQPVDAYTVTIPDADPPAYTSVNNWNRSNGIQRGYLRGTTPLRWMRTEWMVWLFDGHPDANLTWVEEFHPELDPELAGATHYFANTMPANRSQVPESYGDVSTSGPQYVLALGGWAYKHEDENFRFLTIDLADFTNLQAVGRNAFENLGHQQEVATVTEITVPDKCDQIEEYAWKNCTFLKKVTFLCPNITYMSPLAFDGCYDTLEEVRIATNKTQEEFQSGLENYNNNTVEHFVAKFKEEGFDYSFESTDGGNNVIVLRKSPLSVNNNSVDIAEKENVLIDKQVYSSHDQSILTEDLRVTAFDETELPNTDYDIYLRWVNKETNESSGWVKYEDKDSLQVNDVGTYKIEYVIQYKGNNPDLKSNPEGLEIEQDESGGYIVKINGADV